MYQQLTSTCLVQSANIQNLKIIAIPDGICYEQVNFTDDTQNYAGSLSDLNSRLLTRDREL